MKKSFNGHEATFTVRYTETGKQICYLVLEGFGFATTWKEAVGTVREWTEERAYREGLADAEYESMALAYALEAAVCAVIKGRRWIVYSSKGEAVAVWPLSDYNDERAVLVAWGAPRMDIGFNKPKNASCA